MYVCKYFRKLIICFTSLLCHNMGTILERRCMEIIAQIIHPYTNIYTRLCSSILLDHCVGDMVVGAGITISFLELNTVAFAHNKVLQ